MSEFEFYRLSDLDMIGRLVGIDDPRADPGGKTALECWYARDTLGQILPCCEIEVLQKVERGKQSLNLQIKMWAEDVASGPLLQQSELFDCCRVYPEWVFESVMNQAAKLLIENPRIGYVPRFARAEFFRGSLWLPWMDAFDPGL